jgi:hypothetical protein
MQLRDAATRLLAVRGGQEYPPVPQAYGKAVKRTVRKAVAPLRKRARDLSRALEKVASW